MADQPRGHVVFDTDECKGCAMCVEVCPPGCIHLASELNQYGVHPAQYTGVGCTGCGICFYCCPEPGGITVYRLEEKAEEKDSSASAADESVAGAA